MRRPAPLLLLPVLLLPLLAGCGTGLLPGSADGTPRERAREALEQVRENVQEAIDEAVTEAKSTNERSEGDVPSTDPRDGKVLRTDTQTTFDYEEYQATLQTVLASLEEFWAEELPRIGGDYSAPSRYVYYRPEEQPGPSCGGQQAPAKNAFYCPPGDFIAWDESGLMIPYYLSGDFAAAFVLAHEFGHAMQVRLPRQERAGILRELQADCFAGAWARSVQERRLLDAGDLDEAVIGLISARDVPGTPFTDPRAHGSGFERVRAFSDGYQAGAEACYPAPGEEWVVGAT